MEKVINVLKNYVRVIDTEEVKKVEFYDDYGVKLVINKTELTDEEFAEFKKYFREF